MQATSAHVQTNNWAPIAHRTRARVRLKSTDIIGNCMLQSMLFVSPSPIKPTVVCSRVLIIIIIIIIIIMMNFELRS